jgi:hypothetical protein
MPLAPPVIIATLPFTSISLHFQPVKHPTFQSSGTLQEQNHRVGLSLIGFNLPSNA